MGLAEKSTAAAPLYKLIARKPTRGVGDAWVWEYKGPYQDGVESDWVNEDEVREFYSSAAGCISRFVEIASRRKIPFSSTACANKG